MCLPTGWSQKSDCLHSCQKSATQTSLCPGHGATLGSTPQGTWCYPSWSWSQSRMNPHHTRTSPRYQRSKQKRWWVGLKHANCLQLSFCLSVCLPPSLPPSLFLSPSLSLSISPSLPLSSLSLSLSLSLSECVYFSTLLWALVTTPYCIPAWSLNGLTQFWSSKHTILKGQVIYSLNSQDKTCNKVKISYRSVVSCIIQNTQ